MEMVGHVSGPQAVSYIYMNFGDITFRFGLSPDFNFNFDIKAFRLFLNFYIIDIFDYR